MYKLPLSLLLWLAAGGLAGAETLRDPTRPEQIVAPQATPAAEAGVLKLSLLRLGPRPVAVINGRALRPGESLDGYTLIAVEPGRALLQGPEGRLSLSLAAASLQKTKVRP